MRIADIGLSAVLTIAIAGGTAGCAIDPALPGELITPVPAESTVAATVPPVIASPTTEATPTPTVESYASVAFEAVVDGDTVVTSEGTVRLIGIDTPERGECGHAEASAAIGKLVSGGDPVVLLYPEGQNNMDQYGRLLRYVITEDGVDLGLTQLEAGNAIARYDSTDGYPEHPRQASYHAAEVAAAGPDGSVITLACRDRSPGAVAPFTEPNEGGDRWWTQYTSCSKLKKNTAGHPTGPFRQDDPADAAVYDWFANRTGNRGDGDGDGLACE